MGLPLPAMFVPDLIRLGAVWPETDEWKLAASGVAWSRFLAGAAVGTGEANWAVRRMLDANQAVGIEAFGVWWLRLGGAGGHMSVSGMLAGLNAVANQTAAAYVTSYKLSLYALILQYRLLEAEMEALTASGHPEAAVKVKQITESYRRLCLEAYRAVVQLIDGLGVDLAGVVGELCHLAVELLDTRPIHSSPDRVVLDVDTQPISQRLPGAQENPKGKGDFPDTAEPGTVYVRTNPVTGEVLQYATYGDDGYIVKRVDVQGAAHFDVARQEYIPTPHVVYYRHDRNPRTGVVYIRKDDSTVREAHPEEIP